MPPYPFSKNSLQKGVEVQCSVGFVAALSSEGQGAGETLKVSRCHVCVLQVVLTLDTLISPFSI